eukprot:Nitzschia sp. Nitz4//scaffold301_size22573//13889//15625//NITZ4_008555-RA/size22573-processed-gene-0.24-mRNA-1//-1//CDS//3329547019//716//frame0
MSYDEMNPKDSDDVSASARSAAVFDYIKNEASTGNEKPIRQFLETAQVVSDVLLEEEYVSSSDSDQDEVSVDHHQPAMFRLLERASSNTEMSISRASTQLYERLEIPPDEEYESKVSEVSQGVSRVMKYTKNAVDEDDLSVFSAAVFKILDETRKDNEDDNVSLSERSAALLNKGLGRANSSMSSMGRKKVGSHTDDTRDEIDDSASVSNKASAIFRLLDSSPPPDVSTSRSRSKKASRKGWTIDTKDATSEDMDTSVASIATSKAKLSKLQGKNVFHILNQRSSIPAIPENEVLNESDNSPSHLEYLREQILRQVPPGSTPSPRSRNGFEYELAGKFDRAFGEFLAAHPKYKMMRHALVRHFQLAKAKKMIEHINDFEVSLKDQLLGAKESKQAMEMAYQNKLREASRRKAARQINLQAEIGTLSQDTKQRRVQLQWKLVEMVEASSKKYLQQRENHINQRAHVMKKAQDGTLPREEILARIPQDTAGQALKAAIFAGTHVLVEGQDEMALDEEIRKYQVDNAFKVSEIAVLNKKLSHLQQMAKKLAWVDTLMQRVNQVTLLKLKRKVMANEGISMA